MLGLVKGFWLSSDYVFDGGLEQITVPCPLVEGLKAKFGKKIFPGK